MPLPTQHGTLCTDSFTSWRAQQLMYEFILFLINLPLTMLFGLLVGWISKVYLLHSSALFPSLALTCIIWLSSLMHACSQKQVARETTVTQLQEKHSQTAECCCLFTTVDKKKHPKNVSFILYSSSKLHSVVDGFTFLVLCCAMNWPICYSLHARL